MNREELIKENMPLVKSIARKFFIPGKGFEYQDLVNSGVIGLIDAINKFDVEKGAKFSSYSYIKIKSAILDEIRNQSPISKHNLTKVNKYNRVIEKLQAELLREPTSHEIAKELNISEKELNDIESNIDMLNIVSLNHVIFEDTNETIQDVISYREEHTPANIIEEEEKLDILSKAINNLREKEKLILSLYYYEDLNLKEIGKVLGVSESRVSQLHRKSIRNLRNKIKELKYSI
ncbi:MULTISPECIES: sigma-70 family RNA polymerase sigma factor [unclassified Clostridioides]|uniref:sigma-70 family RNA polymerase sigma factor n=1 Tax=unclassified Clostridioides TaxID=2635829 RepID=UPI0006BBDF99|nr:RNA polymerase sigma factor [Clostridioides difficile]MCC0692174.1 FliA/WhiG family RNA polymerase sigma factor [Clostridioides sp. ZZV14-6387]KPI56227.1 RNA polymerase sigma factor [Clostridioides difficile]MCI9976973.1 FliA/WhiG family RNA polymerase sigma factor [Clostridioides difficile]NJI81788.1 FliA/WhiG family RNA polymerase sigma factor [Clostridioides difficile]